MISRYLRQTTLFTRSSFLHSHRSIQISRSLCAKQIPFKLADIGEGIAEVELIQWFVEEGQTISQFQNVCEVQSDKATVEITSRYDGVVKKIHYIAGEMAQVGTTLIDIEVNDDVDDELSQKAPEPVVEIPQVEEQTPVTIKSSEDLLQETPVALESTNNEQPQVRQPSDGKVLSTPSVRRLAKEHNLDLTTIHGTGKDGRVLKGDVLDAVRNGTRESLEIPDEATSLSGGSSAPSTESETLLDYLVKDEVVPIRGVQRLMVASMNASLRVPHFGYNDEVIMDNLHELRHELKPMAESRGISLSYLPLIVKAASLALKQYPILNSSISDDETSITMHAAHNISVAIDTPKGLLVPNIKNVQQKTIFDIAVEMNRLQKLGAEGKISEKDLKNGTFTLSNIGAIGGTYMSPVIMVPQVAIGAIGKIQRLPRFDEDDNVEAVRVMNVSWCGDHRVIDGATMSRFSNLWKYYLENPSSMLVEMR